VGGQSGEQEDGFFPLCYLGLQEGFGIVNWPYMESPTAHHDAPRSNLLVFLYGVWHSVDLEVAINFQSRIVVCNCSKVVEHGSKHLTCFNLSNGQDCLYFYGFCPPNERSTAIKWLIFFFVCLLCCWFIQVFYSGIVHFQRYGCEEVRLCLSVKFKQIPIGH